MSSIRKTKKAMKKSNGFFSVVVDNGISVDYAEYLPYKIMKRVIIER